VLVRDEGLSATVTGAGMAFGVLSEVLVLFAFPIVERRFALSTLLAVAFAGSSLRWWLVSESHGATLLVVLQGFHGLTFGLYWASAIRTLEHLVPSHLRATGQTLFSAVTFAMGGALGYRIAGFGYDRFRGTHAVYARAALVELVPFGLALALRASSEQRARVDR
jgi:PPP family 3-phenylpropionic acid transporter